MSTTRMQLVDYLDDLCVRFIINLPEEELTSAERICFQIEEAQWFYEDFIRPLDPTLPSLSLKKFCELIFQHCPILSAHAELAADAYANFLEYKTRVPVRGAIMLNEAMDNVVLVKGWKKGARWSFPRGKINKDENDLDCAVREVYEETGLDLAEAGLVGPENEMKYIEVNMREQQLRLYVFRGVPEDTYFEPRTRKEISKIEWYRIGDLPTQRKNAAAGELDGNRFYMVAPFIGQLRRWIKLQRQQDLTKPRHAPYHGLDSELEIAGELTAEEDGPLLKPADEMSRLHALLARGGAPAHQVPAMETQASDVDALKQMLGVAAPQPHAADSDPTNQQRNNLLALFSTKPAPPAHAQQPNMATYGGPHTPYDQIIQQPYMAESPHHHQPHQQPLPGPPPPFPLAPGQSSQMAHQNMYSQPHAFANPTGTGHSGHMAPPPSFGLPPHLLQQQQWNEPTAATALPAFQASNLANTTQALAQTPPHTNVKGMAVPQPANLPKPKFGNQQQQGKGHRRQQPSGGFAHHPNAVLDRSDPFMRIPNLAAGVPAQPKRPTATEVASAQPSDRAVEPSNNPTAPSSGVPTQLPTLKQEVDRLNKQKPVSTHASSLLNLFNTPGSTRQEPASNLPPAPAELLGDLGSKMQHRAPHQDAADLHRESQDKLLDLFRSGPGTSSHLSQHSPSEAIHTPDSTALVDDNHGSLNNRRLSARRSYSKGSSSLPQPVLSILQRPVASPHRKTPDVRPPSTPLHTVKNNTPMQAPKPFNPQILKRPAQLESAANAPLPLTVSPELTSSEKEVQVNEQQASLLGLLRGGPAESAKENAPSYPHALDNNPHHQESQSSQPPPYYQPNMTQGYHANAPHGNQIAEFSVHHAPQQKVQEHWQHQQPQASYHNTPPSMQHNTQYHQHAPQSHQQQQQHNTQHTPLVEVPAVPAPQRQSSFPTSIHHTVPTANLQKSPTSALPSLLPPPHRTDADIVSPLDPTIKSRLGSLTISAADSRKGSGSESDRRGSGTQERRESAATQQGQGTNGAKRDFLLGFLEGVVKGGK